MKTKAIVVILLAALVITPMSVARADCDDHWEGAAIALGATMLLNTILWGVPSPVVPPSSAYYTARSPVYYGSYCPPPVVEHYNYYYYGCAPRVHIWLDDCPPYYYRRYWRRPRIYNYHYNYNYYYDHHYNHHYHHHDHRYDHNNCRDRRYCDPYYNHGRYYRSGRYIRY